MLYLSGVECAVTKALRDDGVGLLLNQGGGTTRRVGGYRFAADNGCYQPKDPSRVMDVDRVSSWLCWVGTLPLAGRLFAVAPDVYGDATATWEWSDFWLEGIRLTGWPVALVAQDGAEDHHAMWDEAARWDVLFIGGSTEWKESLVAAECVRRAQELGKWVHVGRVNTGRRFRWASSLGADSADGTMLAFGPDVNGKHLAGWLAENTQPGLFSAPPVGTIAEWTARWRAWVAGELAA